MKIPSVEESEADFSDLACLDQRVMATNNRPFRWGILSTARIGEKNWKAIQLSGNSVVAAVASRSLERGREFITKLQGTAPFANPPRAYGSYEELLADPRIDAVYIPLPTAIRKEWVIRAAEAGKHVLSEKPCAVNSSDLREMFEVCRRNKVQYMDGVMFMHNPRLEKARAVLDDAEQIGELRRITSVFSFLGTGDFQARNIRTQAQFEPLGCLGDLGWYCIRFALWVMRWQLPQTVTGRIISAKEGASSEEFVPLEFSGELFFTGGVSCAFHCSFLAERQQWANVSGAKGYVRIPDFVNPMSDNDTAWEVNYRRVRKEETGLELGAETAARSQETNQFRNFTDQVQSGVLNELWPEIALKTQMVTDACMASARNGRSEVELEPR